MELNDIYLTIEQAEEILMAVEVGMYNIDYPGARSKLAHARLLMDSQQQDAPNGAIKRLRCGVCGTEMTDAPHTCPTANPPHG